MNVATAETHYGADHGLTPAETAVEHFWLHDRHLPTLKPRAQAIGAKVWVRCDRWRWIAQCPHCHGAQLASETDHRFFCIDCANVWCGHLWVETVWPTPDVKAEIETILAERPDIANRNWSPHENLAEIRAENALHLAFPDYTALYEARNKAGV